MRIFSRDNGQNSYQNPPEGKRRSRSAAWGICFQRVEVASRIREIFSPPPSVKYLIERDPRGGGAEDGMAFILLNSAETKGISPPARYGGRQSAPASGSVRQGRDEPFAQADRISKEWKRETPLPANLPFFPAPRQGPATDRTDPDPLDSRRFAVSALAGSPSVRSASRIREPHSGRLLSRRQHQQREFRPGEPGGRAHRPQPGGHARLSGHRPFPQSGAQQGYRNQRCGRSARGYRGFVVRTDPHGVDIAGGGDPGFHSGLSGDIRAQR